MTQERFQEIIANFSDAKIMVVGDIYLDENIFGEMAGISLEAPVPILEVAAKHYNPGAAGNAACNVAALGAQTYIVGFIGDDANGKIVRNELEKRNVDTTGLVTDPHRPTNAYGKLRARTHNAPSQEVLRTDTPTPPFVSGEVQGRLIAKIHELAPKVDAIVLVDQIASVASAEIIGVIVSMAKRHELLTVGDSRSRSNALKGFQIVVPNDREAGIATGIEVTDDATTRQAGEALLQTCDTALVTRGGDGIMIFAPGQEPDEVPVAPCHVEDVTGAGDTVTAAVAVAMVAGATPREAAEIANRAAGIAVGRRGVVTVPLGELERAFMNETGPAKLKSAEELETIVKELQAEGKKIVWTNGCFDILHVGHITYLLKAACAGDVLVVGLNSDQSIRKLKGTNRPINCESDRALVLSSLECVDYVTVFEEESPMALLETLQPDVYAKGGDYTIDTIDQDERRLVENYGGKIHLVPGVQGQSTTAIIDKILNEPSNP